MQTYDRPFKKTAKQYEAIELFSKYIEVLSEGGGRSGKTFIEIYAMIARGIRYPGTNHVALRKRFNHAKLALFKQTIPNVFKIAFPNLYVNPNKSDYFFEFGENKEKSQLWIGGTDDKERIEKILGTEWASMLFNEVSEWSYDTYELLKTRLNPPQGMKPLLMLDHNPPAMSHWTYKKYHLHLDPTNNQKIAEKELNKIAVIKMTPADNKENLNETYMDMLSGLSEAKRRRFEFGEYGNDAEGALWKSQWILSQRLLKKPENMIRVVVAIDPNVTEDKKVNSTTDEAGLITVGKFKIDKVDHYCVIRDDSTPGLSWGEVACDVYTAESADCIVGEVNQGGDLIEKNVRNYNRFVKYKPVRATRGKEVRAEPIADLYRRGLVHHLGELPDLENELTTWVPGVSRSPNRLDALVWAITELMGNATGVANKTIGW